MNKFFMTVATATMLALSVVPVSAAESRVKTRLAHLTGTPLILVVSTLPSEITSITCDSWTMLGVGSWKDQNNFTIPGASVNGVSIAVMDSKGFDGYCKGADSIKAHTDDGDFTGYLDRGAGNWSSSTKLTFGQ